jgi:hypothetical protein
VAQQNILDQVRIAAKQKILFLPHAIRQMAHPEQVITRSEVESVVFGGTLIEDYPEDARGHSCLIGCQSVEGRFVHVVSSPKEGGGGRASAMSLLQRTHGEGHSAFQR